MKRLAVLLAAVALTVGGLSGAQPQPQPPTPQVPAVVPPAPAPAPAPQPKRPHLRGARPTPRWKIFAARKHVPRIAVAPPQFTPAVILTPSQMSYWGNDTYGDCVSAEEAFAKDIYPVWYSTAGTPVNIPTSVVEQAARQHGDLNGADLTEVMDWMAVDGMTSGGVKYTDGPYSSVDYTNWTALCAAIYEGPVKIGVASGQFDNVQGVGENNGWVMHGFRSSNAEDHCVSLCGYGTMQYLAHAMGVTLPSGVDPNSNGLLLFTWDTIGVIDFQSMVNITGEAWIRNPTTPQTVPPQPTPTPTPTPTPGGFTFALAPGAPAGAAIDPTTGVLTWPVPAAQAPGTITLSFTASNAAGTATGSFQVLVTASAAGAPVIAPIPLQAATAGSTLMLDLSKYVTAPAGTRTPTPTPAPTPAPQTPPTPGPSAARDPDAPARPRITGWALTDEIRDEALAASARP